MKKILIEGVKRFRINYFTENKQLYSDLSTTQNPHTLFISCSDSRIFPQEITNSRPGDMFIIRNIANMIPSYQDANTHLSVPSGIEYAVMKLGVENIIVCGHSNCGGINALINDSAYNLPLVNKWLKSGDDIKIEAIRLHALDSNQNIYELSEKLNIVKQLEHLLTYPFIIEKIKNHQLNLIGWYYKIESGEIFYYNPVSNEFELIV